MVPTVPSSKRPARLLVVDDHPLVLDAARNALLASQVAESVDCVSSLHQAREFLARDAAFALIVLDLSLTDANRLEALLAMRGGPPGRAGARVLGRRVSGDHCERVRMQRARLCAEEQQLAVLVNAVRTVLAGGTYIPMHALRTLGSEIATTVHTNDARRRCQT
jgi:DNA-binding NarL/FixJ family response regulator